MLDQAFIRMNHAKKMRFFLNMKNTHRIDVFNIAPAYLNFHNIPIEKYSLVNCAKALGIEFDEKEAHDALFDIELTRKVYIKCMGQ